MGQVDASIAILILITTYYVSTCVVGDLIDDVLNLCSKEEQDDSFLEIR